MSALLRAHVRALFEDPRSAVWGLLFLIAPALILTFLWTLQDPAGLMLRAMTLAAVFGVAGQVRGRASTPAGLDPFGRPMPMLPATERQRLVAIVVISELMLLAAMVLVNVAAGYAMRSLPVSNPYHWTADPERLALALLTYALAWLPVLVAGARLGNSLTPRTLVIGMAVALGVTALGVDHDPLRAGVWAVIGTPLAMRVSATRASNPNPTLQVRPGLRGLLLSMALQTGLLALLCGGIGVLVGLLMGQGFKLMNTLPMVSWTMAALLPLLPAGSTGGQVVPLAPEAFFRLPVDRVEATLAIVATAVARATGTLVLSCLVYVAAVGSIDPHILAFGAVALLTSTVTMSALSALGSSARMLIGWVAVTAATMVTMSVAQRPDWPLWWAIAAQVALVAGGIGALVVSSGRLGWTGRTFA